MDANKGIIVNGGALNADNIIAGDNASMNVFANNTNRNASVTQNTDLQQLSSLIEVLFEKLQVPGEEVANKADLLDAINDLKEEIKKPEPKKSLLKVLGKTVLDNLGYVKTLAPIAQSIWHHISSFIG